MFSDLGPYPGDAESGIPWARTLPMHWDVRRGKALFARLGRPVNESDGVVTCFRDGTVTLRSRRRVTGFTEALQEIGYQGVRAGDLVIHAMDAFAGAVGVSDSDGKCSPVYAVCRPRGGDDPRYYAVVVREMARAQWIVALSRGVRERSTDFRFDAFGAKHLPTPPLEEQAAIVKYLGHAHRRIDQAIAGKRKMIALLEEQKQAIINQAVTRGVDPAARLKDTGIPWLGQIPAHWGSVRFKFKVGFQEGPGIMAADFRDTGVPLLRISCMAGPAVGLEGCNFLDPESVDRRWNHFRIREGDYLLSASGSTGAVKPVGRSTLGAIPYTGLIRLWPRDETTNMEFVRLFMGSVPFVMQIDQAKSGVGIEHFGPTHLKRMWIALPPLDEQRVIVERIASETLVGDAAVGRARREIDLLREFRTRLTADVVTGQLDVRQIADRLPELVLDDVVPGVGDVDDDLEDEVPEFVEDVET